MVVLYKDKALRAVCAVKKVERSKVKKPARRLDRLGARRVNPIGGA